MCVFQLVAVMLCVPACDRHVCSSLWPSCCVFQLVTGMLCVPALVSRTFCDKCIVFLQTKVQAHRMHIVLGLLGVNCGELHGNLSQAQVGSQNPEYFVHPIIGNYSVNSHMKAMTNKRNKQTT